MKEKNERASRIVSASKLLKELFEETLADVEKFDLEVVDLVKKHIGTGSPHSRAGNNLASALVDLAKKRAEEGEK